jgi:hypothetical protein
MELVNNMMMMMMMMILRLTTVTTTTTMQVHSSTNVQDLYLGRAQFESWPSDYPDVFHGFSQSHLVSEQCLEIRP